MYEKRNTISVSWKILKTQKRRGDQATNADPQLDSISEIDVTKGYCLGRNHTLTPPPPSPNMRKTRDAIVKVDKQKRQTKVEHSLEQIRSSPCRDGLLLKV